MAPKNALRTATFAATLCHCQQKSSGSSSAKSPSPQRTPNVSRRTFAKTIILSTTIAALPQPFHPPCAAAMASLTAANSVNPLSDFMRRSFAYDMETAMGNYEEHITPVKRRLFRKLSNADIIVDIGIGTGPNLQYMPQSCTVIGVEPNPYMHSYARRRASTLNINLRLVPAVDSLQRDDANADSDNINNNNDNDNNRIIPLPDHCCDAAITTLTLCSVSDVGAMVRDIARILRPGGVFIFVEHVVADKRRPVLRAVQQVLTPLQAAVADGCHLDRDIASSIREVFAPLQAAEDDMCIERFDVTYGGFEDWISPIRPHIAGYAYKSRRV